MPLKRTPEHRAPLQTHILQNVGACLPEDCGRPWLAGLPRTRRLSGRRRRLADRASGGRSSSAADCAPRLWPSPCTNQIPPGVPRVDGILSVRFSCGVRQRRFVSGHDVVEEVEIRPFATAHEPFRKLRNVMKREMPDGRVRQDLLPRIDPWYDRVHHDCPAEAVRMVSSRSIGDHPANVVADDHNVVATTLLCRGQDHVGDHDLLGQRRHAL